VHLIPLIQIVSVYDKQIRNHVTEEHHVNGGVVIDFIVIKHICNLSDEETIHQIKENMYMQYFICYSGY